MPTNPTFPGVYVEELPSATRTVTGVSTAVTAFIGRAQRGFCNRATLIHNFAEYERLFGGLVRNSPMSYAVQQYYLNGGSDAVIVRVHRGAQIANVPVSGMILNAANEGAWGTKLKATVDHETRDKSDSNLFNLVIEDRDTGAQESFLNVSIQPSSPKFVARVLVESSSLVRLNGAVNARPNAGEYLASGFTGTDGDGDVITDAQIQGNASSPKRGLYALDDADIFNLLCIPPYDYDADAEPSSAVWNEASTYCKRRRAMLIVDPPRNWDTKEDAKSDTGLSGVTRSENAVLYFPRIKAPDPSRENRIETFAPCGAVAGVIARTDTQRGVWKAPAGMEAKLVGAVGMSVSLTDEENGDLNVLGINCLRTFPVIGQVVWGARTLNGADQLTDQWKYLPIRRLALNIEESLYRGIKWAVFEPNNLQLWSALRTNVGAFMNNLFRAGAFQGAKADDAYFVRCGLGDTMVQNDIDRGQVIVIVGFAPLKPAEFVILRIQQMAGQQQ